MKFNYPHTIENGAGEQLTFVRLVEDANGGWLEVENKVQPGSGPPMHVHLFQDEQLTIIQGRVGTQIQGEQEKFYELGETITFHKGQPHRFWNAGTEVLTCKGWIKPADNVEYFLTEIYKSTKAKGGHQPDTFDGAWLSTRYASEFRLTEIPVFVRVVIFPLVVFFGKLAGKHRKFEGAPEPRKK